MPPRPSKFCKANIYKRHDAFRGVSAIELHQQLAQKLVKPTSNRSITVCCAQERNNDIINVLYELHKQGQDLVKIAEGVKVHAADRLGSTGDIKKSLAMHTQMRPVLDWRPI